MFKELAYINSNTIFTHFHFFLFFPSLAVDLNFILSRLPCRKSMSEMVGKRSEEEEDLMLGDMCQRLLLSGTHTSAKLLEAFPLDADGGAQYPDAYAISYQAVPLNCPCLCVLDRFILTSHGKFSED